MERNLKNKIVVITGGAQGIGYAIADNFLQEDTKVLILLDINSEKGQQAVELLNSKHGEGKAVFMKCDVIKDLEAVSNEIFQKYARVDVLVNNAGIARGAPRKMIDVLLTATIEWTLKFNEHMEANGGGTILNNASILAFKVAPYVPIYSAAKFGVLGFTKCFGHEYNFRKTGVRVLAICPGFTETNLVVGLKTKEIIDNQVYTDLKKYSIESGWQKVDAVGRGAVEAFKIGGSGTAWIIENDQPIVEVV